MVDIGQILTISFNYTHVIQPFTTQTRVTHHCVTLSLFFHKLIYHYYWLVVARSHYRLKGHSFSIS